MEGTELIEALKAGSADAFRMLLTDYGDRVYNTALGMLQRTADAEDVAQEVFVSVYQHIGRFRGDAKLSTWIYRIAVTKSLEALRSKELKASRARKELDDSHGVPAMPFHHPGVRLENREAAAVLFAALSKLPENQKTAFVLHKTEGLSYAEVGEVMKLSLPAVESLIYRARQGLQKLLAQYYREP